MTIYEDACFNTIDKHIRKIQGNKCREIREIKNSTDVGRSRKGLQTQY